MSMRPSSKCFFYPQCGFKQDIEWHHSLDRRPIQLHHTRVLLTLTCVVYCLENPLTGFIHTQFKNICVLKLQLVAVKDTHLPKHPPTKQQCQARENHCFNFYIPSFRCSAGMTKSLLSKQKKTLFSSLSTSYIWCKN